MANTMTPFELLTHTEKQLAGVKKAQQKDTERTDFYQLQIDGLIKKIEKIIGQNEDEIVEDSANAEYDKEQEEEEVA